MRLTFIGTGDPADDSYPHGYEYTRRINSYVLVDMDDPTELLFCRAYEYGIVILSDYLPLPPLLKTYRTSTLLMNMDWSYAHQVH